VCLDQDLSPGLNLSQQKSTWRWVYTVITVDGPLDRLDGRHRHFWNTVVLTFWWYGPSTVPLLQCEIAMTVSLHSPDRNVLKWWCQNEGLQCSLCGRLMSALHWVSFRVFMLLKLKGCRQINEKHAWHVQSTYTHPHPHMHLHFPFPRASTERMPTALTAIWHVQLPHNLAHTPHTTLP